MRYFVKGEFVEPGPTFSDRPFSDRRFVQMLENTILPSFENVIKLEKEKKILASGLFTGARAGVFIIDAESNDELTRLLYTLPFWGIIKWEVIPLDTFEDRIQIDRKLLQNLKK